MQVVRYPGAGCIVEFMQGNAPQIAWVMEEQGGKVRLMLPNRRELSLTANRLLPWAGPQYGTGKSREDIVGLLTEHQTRREQQAAAIDAVELWELAQGEMDKASPVWLAELGASNPDVDAIAACGQALLACKTHFKFQPPDFEIYSAETVEARRLAEESAREREILVGGGATWLKHLWECRQQRKTPDPDKFAPEGEAIKRLAALLWNRILQQNSQEDEVLWKQVSKGLPDEPHLPLLLSIAWGLVPEHYNFWLARTGYETGEEWSQAHATEIASILERLEDEREAILEVPFISIDSATTRDIDDAFHIVSREEGGWDLLVALACPAIVWPFGQPLDQAVQQRGTSIYLPEGTYHMMPPVLSTEAFSLHADQDKPALILHCRVAADGTVQDATPRLQWVRLAANLTYSACEAVLEGEEESATENAALAYKNVLQAGYDLAVARQAVRIQQGAVIIEKPEADFYLVGDGANVEVFLKETQESPKAQLLVSELMVLANAALATWAVEHNIPLLFRTQDVTIPPGFAGLWTRPQDIARVVKVMAPASLDVVARRHAGMGLDVYASMSSPLRRYPDLVNESQILHYLESGTPRWTQGELSTLLTLLQQHLDAAGMVQRFRPRYWKLLYVAQQAAKHGDACIWEGTISEANDGFVTVSMEREQLLVRGKRNLFGDKAAPGQRWKLRLGKISPLHGEVSILAAQAMEEEVS